MMPARPDPPIRIGISSCLLGEKVRYDGGHKLDRFLVETFVPFFEWVLVCPEVEAGFGTPREAMRLEQFESGVGLGTVKSHRDLTPRLKAYAAARIDTLSSESLSGYILKSNSPSCGLAGVPVHGAGNKAGRGLFAAALLDRFPALPAEEESRLCDPAIRENWIQRVFAYYRMNRLWAARWSIRDLQAFHAQHKLALLAHSPAGIRTLGRLLARAKDIPRKELKQQYEAGFMRIMSLMATRGKHANVLQHAAGYLKKLLDEESRRELSDSIEDYRKGKIPFLAPLTRIMHHVRRYDLPYLAAQVYLNPCPKELALQIHRDRDGGHYDE